MRLVIWRSLNYIIAYISLFLSIKFSYQSVFGQFMNRSKLVNNTISFLFVPIGLSAEQTLFNGMLILCRYTQSFNLHNFLFHFFYAINICFEIAHGFNINPCWFSPMLILKLEIRSFSFILFFSFWSRKHFCWLKEKELTKARIIAPF